MDVELFDCDPDVLQSYETERRVYMAAPYYCTDPFSGNDVQHDKMAADAKGENMQRDTPEHSQNTAHINERQRRYLKTMTRVFRLMVQMLVGRGCNGTLGTNCRHYAS